MTERQIENRIKKLQEIEAQQKALEQEAEAQRHEAQLEKNGYKVIANCYWKVIFQKADGWTVQVNREF